MSKDLPQIDDAYIRRVYDTLTAMQVDLDSDPLVYGPKRLNGKVAACRRHLSRCQQIYLDLADDLQRIGRTLRREKLDFDLCLQDLLTNDPNVLQGRNMRDREAIALTRLRAEREAISTLEASHSDVEAILQVVKAKREDLKDVQGRIRDQIKLCQEEMGLGATWGSSLHLDSDIQVDLEQRPRVNVQAMESLSRLMQGVEGDPTTMDDLEAYVAAETSRTEPEPPVIDISEALVDVQDILQDPKPPVEVSASPAIDHNQQSEDPLGETSGDIEDPLKDFFEEDTPEVSLTAVVVEGPPASASQSDVDMFLDDVDVTRPPEAHVNGMVSDDVDFDDLLAGL